MENKFINSKRGCSSRVFKSDDVVIWIVVVAS